MKLKQLLEKIKKIKNIEIILAALLCIVVIAVCFIDFDNGNTEQDNLSEYISKQQHQIEKLLDKIDGVSNISVVITYKSGIEQVFAYNTSTQTKNEQSTTKTELIMVGDKPLVAQELLPKISGVVVVMSGDAVARLKVIEALKTLLLVEENQIKVYSN